MADSPRWPPLLAVLVVLAAGALAWPFTIDDAYIVARYAQNLLSGGGYGFNAGSPSDGVTGPLWLLPTILGQWLASAPVVFAKALDLVCAATAAWLVTRRAGRRGLWVALLVGTNAAFLPWAVAGLGSGLAALLLVCAAPRETPRSGGFAGAAVGLLAWLRPEACVAGAVLLLGQGRASRRRALGMAAAGLLLVVALRWALFGDLLPMALAAKPSTPLSGLGYVARGALVSFGVVGLVPVAWAVCASSRGRVYASAVAAHLLAVAFAGGDWMPGFRLLAPIVPIYALAFALGLGPLRRARPRVALALAALGLALPLFFAGLELPELRASGMRRDQVGAELALQLAATAGPVALVDIGYLGYRAGVDVVDLGGVTDPVVAGSPGGHLDKRIDPAYLAWRDPAAILLHAATAPEVDEDGNLIRLTGYPVERRVAAMPFVRLRYRVERVLPYAPGYFYVLLLRRPVRGDLSRATAPCCRPCPPPSWDPGRPPPAEASCGR